MVREDDLNQRDVDVLGTGQDLAVENFMRPHMAHLHNTMLKKQLADEARNEKTSYRKCRAKVDQAINMGYPKQAIAEELEDEILRIQADKKEGDQIFQQGVHNAKVSCVAAIRVIISELKGENNG